MNKSILDLTRAGENFFKKLEPRGGNTTNMLLRAVQSSLISGFPLTLYFKNMSELLHAKQSLLNEVLPSVLPHAEIKVRQSSVAGERFSILFFLQLSEFSSPYRSLPGDRF